MVIRNAVTSLRNSVVASSAGPGSGEVELGHDSNGDDKLWYNRSWGRSLMGVIIMTQDWKSYSPDA